MSQQINHKTSFCIISLLVITAIYPAKQQISPSIQALKRKIKLYQSYQADLTKKINSKYYAPKKHLRKRKIFETLRTSLIEKEMIAQHALFWAKSSKCLGNRYIAKILYERIKAGKYHIRYYLLKNSRT